MKRHLLSLIASLAIAGALVGAQGPQPAPQSPAPQPSAPEAPAPQPAQPAQPSQPADRPAPPSPSAQPSQAAEPNRDDADDTTLKGCLVQGSGPNVFILDNAKPSSAADTSKGERYILEISATPEQLKPVMNSHVEVNGTAKKAEKADAAPAAAGQDASEAALPKLTAKRITRIAETCPAATGD
jgi:hypothetical protein